MKKYNKFLAVLLAVVVLLPVLAEVVQAVPEELNQPENIRRFAGKGRVETSIEVSKEAFGNNQAKNVVLAGYNGEVDALTGTLLAADKEAPLILTNKDRVPKEVKKELKRLGAENIYILGGEWVVSKNVETDLEKDYIVKRIAGKDREKTAVRVAEEVGGNTDHIFLAKGYDVLADALAVGPVSAIKDMPVFLTNTNKTTKATLDAMETLGVKEVTIVGGEGAVTQAVADQLVDYKVNRISDSNREKTALKIADKFFTNSKHSIVANGYVYADALVGGYLGAKKNAPILLVNNKALTKDAEEFISSKISKASVLGGEKVINKSTFNNIKDLLNGKDDGTNGSEITRGEWLELLSKKLFIDPIDIDEDFNYFYADSEDSKYGSLIETVNALGLIPKADETEPIFEADKVASREFVAYTVAKGMGFEGEYELESSDLSSIKYKSEVAIMVQQEFLNLIDNNFMPDKGITDDDKNQIFKKIDYFNNSLKVEESEIKEEIEYNSDVVELIDKDYKVAENKDGTYEVTLTKNNTTKNITKATVLTLPASDKYIGGIALKVTAVQDSGESIMLSCITPSFEEVVKDVDVKGRGNLDSSKIKTAEGVTAEYVEGETLGNSDGEIAPYDLDYSDLHLGVIKYSMDEIKLNDDEITINGDIQVEIPQVSVKFDYGFLKINEASVQMLNKSQVNVEGQYELGVADGEYEDSDEKNSKISSGKTEIGSISYVIGTTPFTFDVVVFLNISASGKGSISFELSQTSGFQYKDGSFRKIEDYNAELLDIDMNAELITGLGISGQLSILSIETLAGIDTHAGLGLEAKFKAHTDVEPTLYCGEGLGYLYATIELDKETTVLGIIHKMLRSPSWSWHIYDRDSSIFRKHYHLENGKSVDECTYEKTSETDKKYFNFHKETGTIISYSDDGPKDVIIPKKIDGLEVKEIGGSSFYAQELTSVVIPDTVTLIGREAFIFNNLTSIEIPDSVKKIELYAFFHNKLESLEIPNSVTDIGAYAFSENNIESVTIPNSIKNISLGLFEGNKLKTVTIPDSVETIEDSAFYKNNLEIVTIPSHTELIPMGGSHFDKDVEVNRKYRNDKYGFSLKIPIIWDGIYELKETSDGNDYLDFAITKNGKYLADLITITMVPENQEIFGHDMKIGENRGYVFIFGSAHDTPEEILKPENKEEYDLYLQFFNNGDGYKIMDSIKFY